MAKGRELRDFSLRLKEITWFMEIGKRHRFAGYVEWIGLGDGNLGPLWLSAYGFPLSPNPSSPNPYAVGEEPKLGNRVKDVGFWV